MKPDQYKISIIVPSYAQGAYIENCIKSVLKQSYTNWELIIQDGASKDNTKEVCDIYAANDDRIIFTSEPDKGFADAVNKGLAKATGTLAIIQSSDDFFANAHVFEDAVSIYEANKQLILIAGASFVVDEDLRHLATQERIEKYVPVENVFTLRDHFSQGATFFSVKRARDIGGLDPLLDMVADTDFWVRLCCYDSFNINSVYQTSKIWGGVMVQPTQRSADLSKFYLGRARMAASHFKNDHIRFEKAFKLLHANNFIHAGLEHFKGIGMDVLPFYEIYEAINGKAMINVENKRARNPIKNIARLLLKKVEKNKFTINSKEAYYANNSALSSFYNCKWFA